jgi:hypothetical protein
MLERPLIIEGLLFFARRQILRNRFFRDTDSSSTTGPAVATVPDQTEGTEFINQAG